MKTLRERFEEKYIPEPNSGCWLWTEGLFHFGHGKFWMGGRSHIASRVAWQLYVGAIPKDMCVLHKCDNPGCVNPDHLFLGTKGDNSKDMYAKGRQRHQRGDDRPFARLDRAAVIDIRSGKLTGAEYAEKYGVSRPTVCKAAKGYTWKHVEGRERFLNDTTINVGVAKEG